MPNRNISAQPFENRQLTVSTTALPLQPNVNQSAYYSTFAIAVPSAEAQGVFLGDAAVTVGNGFPIEVGVPLVFAIENQRVFYDLRDPLLDIAEAVGCAPQTAVEIPFIAWDLGGLFAVAAAATDVRLLFFKAGFV